MSLADSEIEQTSVPAVGRTRQNANESPVFSFFRYVLHAHRPAYEALGWAFAADLGPVHGHYSVLMHWAGPGEPVEPEKAAA